MTLKWDNVVDVVVIGYGGAGAAAAIAAHDAGAGVLVLESTGQGGGNTLVSFGGFICPEDHGKALDISPASMNIPIRKGTTNSFGPLSKSLQKTLNG